MCGGGSELDGARRPFNTRTTSDGVSIAWTEIGHGPALLVLRQTPFTHVQELSRVVRALTSTRWHARFALLLSMRAARACRNATSRTCRTTRCCSDAEAVIDAAKLERFVVMRRCRACSPRRRPLRLANDTPSTSDASSSSRSPYPEHARAGRYAVWPRRAARSPSRTGRSYGRRSFAFWAARTRRQRPGVDPMARAAAAMGRCPRRPAIRQALRSALTWVTSSAASRNRRWFCGTSPACSRRGLLSASRRRFPGRNSAVCGRES